MAQVNLSTKQKQIVDIEGGLVFAVGREGMDGSLRLQMQTITFRTDG